MGLMIAVIIAGGSGSRLWPLSTPDYPKHLLALADNRSLIQNSFTRARLLSEDVYVVSEASHVGHVYEQLPELAKDRVIVEPGRRGTASCVIAALAAIKQHHDTDQPIIFMHADHHIRDTFGFVDTIRRAGQASIEKQQIVLLGVEPTHAATGFGYIERGDNANGGRPIYNVKSFKEKPDHATAEKYLSQGRYLWNMGYFIAPFNVFENSIKTHAPHLWENYQKLIATQNEADFSKQYLEFPNEPIDTALIEKVPDLLVTPGSFDWMDMGSYPDVHQASAQDVSGNAIRGNVETDGVTNSLIRNDIDIPVVVIGLDNVAVVSTPQGILVTNKSYAQKVGEISKKLNDKSS